MEKLYAVCWGSGSTDDHGNAHAYSGIVGVYRNKEDAKKALETYKDETLEEVYEDVDPDGEFPEKRDSVKVYGLVEDEYFEIDYTLGTEPVEIYIGISETELI
jgi:hypothetical protein